MPLLTQTLHPRPVQAFLSPCPPWPMKHPYHTPLRITQIFSILPSDKPKEEPTSVTYYTPSDSPRPKPSSLLETSSSELPIEKLTPILATGPNVYSPSGYTTRFNIYSYRIFLEKKPHSDMCYQKKKLPQFLILTQICTLPVEILQAFLLYYNLSFLQKN